MIPTIEFTRDEFLALSSLFGAYSAAKSFVTTPETTSAALLSLSKRGFASGVEVDGKTSWTITNHGIAAISSGRAKILRPKSTRCRHDFSDGDICSKCDALRSLRRSA